MMEFRRERPSVPAITLSPLRNPITPCPCCGRTFKRLGCHLPKCKERGERDYTAYLTKQSQHEPVAKRVQCPKCNRFFRRLDTHLRVSAVCRDPVALAAASGEPAPAMGETGPGPAATAVLSGPDSNPASRTTPSAQQLQRVPPLKLPKTTDEWVEANQLLTQVLPAVVRCSSVEDKSRVLGELTYSLLRERFGCRPLPRARKRRQGQERQHNRALKKVTILKNEARQALRQAKRSNREEEEIRSRCGKFLSLLREYSR